MWNTLRPFAESGESGDWLSKLRKKAQDEKKAWEQRNLLSGM